MASGDAAALDSLFRVTAARIHGLARRLVRDPDVAEEVVVDTYARAWRKAPDYAPERGSVALWLSTIARRIAIDRLRERRGDAGLDGLEELPSSAPSPFQASLSAENADCVRNALRGLPPDQRRAIEVTFFEGLTHAEAAKALGQPLGTLKSRIRSGLRAIRGQLGFAEEGAA